MKKKDIKPDTFPKYTPSPVFADLPKHLKDPKNYNKVQERLLEALATTHSHSDLEEWAKCKDCMEDVAKHRKEMEKIGFTSPEQYMAWKKVMDIIINKKRVPLR